MRGFLKFYLSIIKILCFFSNRRCNQHIKPFSGCHVQQNGFSNTVCEQSDSSMFPLHFRLKFSQGCCMWVRGNGCTSTGPLIDRRITVYSFCLCHDVDWTITFRCSMIGSMRTVVFYFQFCLQLSDFASEFSLLTSFPVTITYWLNKSNNRISSRQSVLFALSTIFFR